MITKLRYVFSITIVFLSFSVKGQSAYWTLNTTKNTSDNIRINSLKKDSYAVLSLNESIFKNTLINAPQHQSISSIIPKFIELPDDKGQLITFRIFEQSVLSQSLGDKYPEIKSYTGYAVKNSAIRVYFSSAPSGIRSMMIYGDGRTVFMEKKDTETSEYIVYQRSSRLKNQSVFLCTTTESKQERSTIQSNEFTESSSLKKYRIAVSASGEYTAFHGGSKAAALAAINATLTRVNAVFESDLGIFLELVENTESVIFTDAATDPYTSLLTSELQDVLDRTIGSSNYDVGHLFHRAIDNGNAGCIGCVCVDGRKGSGFSATTSPFEDTFDIDYVAHELGHQFGANHSWSFESEGTGVNMEPASGSTIMGYAGIAGRNNIQLNSDPYFHYISILQINNYIRNTACVVNTPTLNSPPVADAGPDYFIPKSTPFVLRGSATDTDSQDVLSYSWEQIDDGIITYENFGTTNSEGANFRSLPPSEDTFRYFPRLSRVISGDLTERSPGLDDAWESVSDIAKEMNFAFTVRDHAIGGGSTTSDLMKVTIVQDSRPFVVSSHTTPQVLQAGTVEIIEWDVANTNIPPINASEVDILLSTDGGKSFPVVLAEDVVNDGSHPLVIPGGIASSEARIMVKGSDHIFFAVNNADLRVEEAAFVLNFDQLEYAICQPEDLILNFSYATFNGFNEETSLSVSNLPVGLVAAFSASSVVSNGTSVTLNLSNTQDVAPGIYTITVQADAASVSQSVPVTLNISDNAFDFVALQHPLDGATDIFLSADLEWVPLPSAESYDIELATDAEFTNLITSVTVIDSFFQVNNLLSDTVYYWRVRPRNQCVLGDFGKAFSFTTTSINCKIFSYSEAPLIISEEGTPVVRATIDIIDEIQLSDVKVGVDIIHSFISDLSIKLISPTGTEVTLITGACGGADDINATFDDNGGPAFCFNAPAISGNVKPSQSLQGFFGELIAGTWTLEVRDTFNFDGGFLNGFTLDICAGGAFLEDSDNDGIPDITDNCINTFNTDQADLDDDGIGDFCDEDDDNDGIPDRIDNCIHFPNPNQLDNDADGIGDSCDEDDDNDGIPDVTDNCPFQFNADQLDSDGDGTGDICDDDILVSEAITPNGDGINDSWSIINIERYPQAIISVYSRSGNEVYRSVGYTVAWNGVYKDNNERLPAGSYFYRIDLTGNGQADQSGWLYITY